MKIDKKTLFERMRVGYFEPPENIHHCCRLCGAVTKMSKKSDKVKMAPYYCRRHKFFVRKDGCCNDQSPEPFDPNPVQPMLGDLFEESAKS